MLYLKILCYVSLLLGVYELEAVRTRGQQYTETEDRKLIRACPEIPISDPDTANIDIQPFNIVLKLELPSNFQVSRTYPHLTEDNHIGLISLTQLANSPQLFYNYETDYYALAINGYTFSNGDTDLKITSYTYMAAVFSLKNKFEYAPYAFSDNTSEVRPTLIAKTFSITNLTEVPSSGTDAQHHILPYVIMSNKGYTYLPINIKLGDEMQKTFTSNSKSPFSNK